jgi:Domain of unknown function (DUF4258)
VIRYSLHAEEAMAERGIDRAWIEAAIAEPDRTEPDPRGGRTRSYRAIPEFDGRVPQVVHRPAGADIMVITAHFDRSSTMIRTSYDPEADARPHLRKEIITDPGTALRHNMPLVQLVR